MMKNNFELILNPFFYIPVLTFVVGQAIKVGLQLGKGEKGVKYLLASGGMPSVHTATVVALAATAVLKLGAAEPISGILVIFAGIVVYDSFGVRRSAGEQAAVLNLLIDDLEKQHELRGKYKKLREVLGHRPEETAAGGLLGLLSGWLLVKYPGILSIFTIEQLFSVPSFSQTMLRGFLVVFGGVMIWAVLLKIWTIGKKVSDVKKKLQRKLFLFSLCTGAFGLLYAFVSFQKINVVSFPVWFILGILVFIAWGISISSYYYTKYLHETEEWRDNERKNKWLA